MFCPHLITDEVPPVDLPRLTESVIRFVQFMSTSAWSISHDLAPAPKDLVLSLKNEVSNWVTP